jgi:hypothetical protein
MVNSPPHPDTPPPLESGMAANNMSNHGMNNFGGTMDNRYGHGQVDRGSLGTYGTPTNFEASMYPSRYLAGQSVSYGLDPHYDRSMGQGLSQDEAQFIQSQAYSQAFAPGGDSFSGTSKNQIAPRLSHGTPHGSTSPDALATGTT